MNLTKLSDDLELRLKDKVLACLKLGRSNWDVPHTLACVFWMKELMQSEGGEERILIPAIYLHDIGYPLLEKGYTLNQVIDSKSIHKGQGARLAEDILSELKFSPAEIDRIVHLVRVHDDLKRLDSHDEIMMFEADSLGQIDVERVPPSFSKQDYSQFMDRFERHRVPLFRTRIGKVYLEILLARAKSYFSEFDVK